MRKLWKHIRYKIIFANQLSFGVFFLKLFGNRNYTKALTISLKHCKEGTIGKELWYFLQKNKFELVPYYEKHDLKHVILGYDTDPADEMRMQAFMFGNCGFPVFISIVYVFFVIWTPEMWKDIATHYKMGKLVKPLKNYRIEDIGEQNLRKFQNEIGLWKAKAWLNESVLITSKP